MNTMTAITILSIPCFSATLGGCDQTPDADEIEVPPTRQGNPVERREDQQKLIKDRVGAAPSTDNTESLINMARAKFGEDSGPIKGEVKFVQKPEGVEVSAVISEGPPGKHGFHIHEHGDCSDIENKSMGSHFDPEGRQHALPNEEGASHLGDMGNLEIGDDGAGRLKLMISGASLSKNAKTSLVQKAVIVHSGEDQGKAKQPAGDSGTPVGCAIIEEE